MLVNLKEILEIADKENIAIGSFNTPNLEAAIAIIAAAEELNKPVIIMHAQIHEELVPLKIIAPIMIDFAKKAKVPVCVHLDHGTDVEYLKIALELGFTSVMYDGSEHDYETNLANTKYVVELAKKYDASVEAEIGVMARKETLDGDDSEDDGNEDTSMYTDPAVAEEFAKESGIDALACAFGTAHGLYAKTPKLDFERLAEIDSRINVPVVMHGGSGVSPEDYVKAINNGVRKINYYTYMAKAGADGVKQNIDKVSFYHEIVNLAIDAMREDVKKAIKVFSKM